MRHYVKFRYNLKGREHLSDLDVDGTIPLKRIVKNSDEKVTWIGMFSCRLPDLLSDSENGVTVFFRNTGQLQHDCTASRRQ